MVIIKIIGNEVDIEIKKYLTKLYFGIDQKIKNLSDKKHLILNK